jgi:hypothetical protein
MPDFNSTLDVVVQQLRQEARLATQVDATWRMLLIGGTAVLVALVVAAFILAARWLPHVWRRPPPPPTSIIPQQPDKQRRYTETKRR